MSVGDVNSPERGSGARFNDGKLDLTLLPPWAWQELADRKDDTGSFRLCFGRELEYLIGFWEGEDDDIYHALDGLTDDDFEAAARVFAYGARKYAPWNWAKGMHWSIPMACYLRHMILVDPDSEDGESGISHRGHAVCNLIMLSHFAQLCPDLDDRPHEIRPEWHEGKVDKVCEFDEDDEDPVAGFDEFDEMEPDFCGPQWEEVPHGVFRVRYREHFHSHEREEDVGDLPTGVLNDLVETCTEEQESRERTLRATGRLT